MPAHGKGANIFANGYDLSPFLSSIDQTQTVDTAEVTTFTAQSKAYIAGQMDSTLSMSGYFDGVASGVDEVLSAALDSDAATVLTVAEGGVGTVGNRALVASGLEPGAIDAVVKTGGSSNIPLFTAMLARVFGAEKVKASNAFSSVVAGLAIKAGR